MKKRYQIDREQAVRRFREQAATSEQELQLQLPLKEVAAALQEGVGHLMRQAGLELMQLIMDNEVRNLAGERYERREREQPFRWGRERGSLVVDGQKVPVERPRLRGEDGREQRLGSYELFRRDQPLEAAVWDKLMLGLSTRNYGQAVRTFAESYGIEKSAVSEHFVRVSGEKLRELLERSLKKLKLCAIYLDGIEFKGQCLVVALGVNVDGAKKVLGLRQGASENATVVGQLLEDLVKRGVDFSVPMLYVLDGAKALTKAVRKHAGAEALIQRCQIHIAGRDPRQPEGWKVPSRARPCEPGSLGSGMARRLAMSKQTRHVASEPSPEARANVQAVPQGNVWRRHGSPNGNHWESSETGWSSLLCMGEDSNGCGCVGKRSSRRPRRFEQRHERKVA